MKSDTIFDKLWWVWLPIEIAVQIYFCFIVFKHWKNSSLKFSNGGLTPEYVEPAPRPTLSESRDDESMLIDGPRHFTKDIELQTLAPKPSLRKKKRILKKMEKEE